jgi:hypothetical protein
MTSVTPSFEKFNYLIRPSKQVERKLFIEALLRLSRNGMPIPQYTYLGFGSVYYADFVLFHKYLYIDKMICVEARPIPKRMEFNKPFEFIRLRMKQVAEVIPELDRSEKYVVWLDYEQYLDQNVLRDTAGLLHVLAPGSVLIVTVDADPRLLEESEADEDCRDRRASDLVEMFQTELGKYRTGAVTRKDTSRTGLPRLFAAVMRNQFAEELGTRAPVQFHQLFNFKYSDGAQMLTVGGIVGADDVKATIAASGIRLLSFVTEGEDPVKISVPPLTVREKHWLDQNLDPALRADRLAFEMSQEYLDNFRSYYRHYPTYYETLL